MPIKIKSTEKIGSKNIFAVIYGIDGVGKSTFALESNKPLWAAYDVRGIVRPSNRKEGLRFSNWEDIADYFDLYQVNFKRGLPSPFRQDYPTIETLVHDTIGIMLDDYLVPYIANNYKGSTRTDGSLSMNGYGAMKHLFGMFIDALGRIDCDHVMVCHASYPKDEAENQIIKPRISGGSLNVLMERADMCCFIEISKGGKRLYNFDQDQRKQGKNTGKISKGYIPDEDTTLFKGIFGRLITKTKERIISNGAANVAASKILDDLKDCSSLKHYYEIIKNNPIGAEYAVVDVDKIGFDLWMEKVDLCESVDQFNKFLAVAKTKEIPCSSVVRKAFSDRAKDKGLIYDKKSEKYLDSTPSEGNKDTISDPSVLDTILESLEDAEDSKVIEALYGAAKQKLTGEELSKVEEVIRNKSNTNKAA